MTEPHPLIGACREVIARRVQAKTNRDQYTSATWDEMKIFHSAYFSEADAILAIVQKRLAPVLAAAEAMRDDYDILTGADGNDVISERRSASRIKSMRAYDAAVRTAADGGA